MALAGLSNAPYLLAGVRDASVTFAVTPSRVRFQARTRGLRTITDTPNRKSTRRGVVTEFSWRSRRRLHERALDLGAMERPDLMVTLTVPGEWRSAVADGAAFKRCVRLYRGRLGRWLERHHVGEWSALWFLEFQARGAPHLHCILWGPGVRALDRREFAAWSSGAWAEVVGHRDAEQRRRHLAAGSRVERMRSDHFGYACAYASKMKQKRVPEGFRNVGRFWGFWQYRPPQPVVWQFEHLTGEQVAAVVRSLAASSVTEKFGAALVRRFAEASAHSDTFSATIFGEGAVHAALDLPQPERVSLRSGAPHQRRAVPTGVSVGGAM